MKVQKDEKNAELGNKELNRQSYLKFSGISQVNKAYTMEKRNQSSIEASTDENQNMSYKASDRVDSYGNRSEGVIITSRKSLNDIASLTHRQFVNMQ